MKIKAISFNQTRIQRQNRWFSAYHNCINSSRCNKLFGLIFLMSIGAIFTAVIVMAVIRADLFYYDNDNLTSSNTTPETVDDGNSPHIAIDGLLESLNVTPGEFDIVQDTLTTSDEITTLSMDDWGKNRDESDEEVTSPPPEVTTSPSTISFVIPTDSETSTINTIPPINNPSKCNVQVGSGNCLISCIAAESVFLKSELTKAINDLTANSCPMHNLHLLLESIRLPPDDEPEHDWLGDLNSISSITFVNFTMTRSEIEQLTESSFANGPFSGVNHMIFSDMDRLLLQNNSLIGLTSLSTLTFKNIKFFLPQLHFNLIPLSSTLTNLEVSGTTNVWNIHRLTAGPNLFEKVYNVVFSNNYFAATNLNFPFIGVCSTVKFIYLSNSSISQLSSNMFFNCSNLEVVDLANNLLTSIPQNIFEGTNLRYLYLENNQLQNLPDGLLPNLRLQGLRVTNNPWNCSFEILYLKKLMEIPEIIFNGGINSNCSSPSNLEGTKISDLWCSRSSCQISCRDTDQETLSNVLKIYSMTNCSSVDVELLNHNFDNKLIPSYWLSNLTYSINILNMISTPITLFEENAFNSSTFNPLKQLTIDNTRDFRENFLKLKRESFNGLNQIKKFEMIAIPQIIVDDNQSDVFREISSTIVVLSLANCNMIFLRRLFENITFERIENLDLTGNSFISIPITNTSLAGVQGNVKKLILSYSRIIKIDLGTFDYFQQLEELDLQGNNLQTLPVTIFDVIKATHQYFRVFLENNLWNCNTNLCHLLPFVNENVLCSTGEPMTNLVEICTATTTEIKTTEEESEEPQTTTITEAVSSSLTISNETSTSSETPATTLSTTEEPTTSSSTEEPSTSTSTIADPPTTPVTTSTLPPTTTIPITTSTTLEVTTPIQTTQETQSTQEITTESSTTSLSEDTTSISSQRTTNIPGNSGNIQVPCVDGSLNVSHIRINTSVISLPNRDQVTFYRPPFLFTIRGTKPNEVSVTFDGNEDGMVLLYYPAYFNPFDSIDDEPSSNPQCVVVTNDVVVVGNLLVNTVYTFCSLFSTPIFTPFQCMSYSNTEGMPWLYEEQKAVVITSLTLILLFVLTAGIIMTYFLIRRMPTLIRGSKRVVIVNNRTKEVMILPRSDNDSRSNSFRKESVVTPIVPEPPTYLTPRPRQSVEHRPPFVRSNSDTSLKSYVSVSRLPPRFSQVYQHGDFDNKSQSRHRNGSYPRQMPSAPFQQSPELPPPLPRRSIVSTGSSVHHSIASTAEIGKLSRSNNHHNSTFRHRPGQCEVEEENHYNIII